MNTINTNNANNDGNPVNDNKMTTSKTHTIKINFEGDSREIDVPPSMTLAGLEAAIASAFSVDVPARSGVDEASHESDLSFTYKDPDGDDIVLDQDAELSLALRLLRGSLEISAVRKQKENENENEDGDPERRLYKIAARNLREYHGVPSMTPTKLTKTLTLLELNARCLVKQGLAPRKLLGRIKATKGAKHQHVGDEGHEDLAEYAASGVDVMASDDAKEWNDGFVAVDQPASGCDGAITSSSSDDENDENADAPAAVKNPLHKAFVDGGVQLRPREVRPLLLALAVRPCRLVRLGLVDAKD
ncbi:unnamed protein product, partial [Hapterophycus canaliculatus]